MTKSALMMAVMMNQMSDDGSNDATDEMDESEVHRAREQWRRHNKQR